jgi:hypothetical protein
VRVRVDDLENHPALVRRYLLGVAAVGHRLVLVVLQPGVNFAKPFRPKFTDET